MSIFRPFSLGAALFLAGCAGDVDVLAPNLKGFDTLAVRQFTTLATPHQKTMTWHTLIKDATLRDFIDTALAHNRDLKRLKEVLRETQAGKSITANANLPQVQLNGGFSRGNRGFNTQNEVLNMIDVHADISWELDLFGANYYRNEAQKHLILSATHALEAAQLSLVSSIVITYNHYLMYRAQWHLATDATHIAKERLSLAQKRVNAGLDDGRMVLTIAQIVEEAERTSAILEGKKEVAKADLTTLVGVPCDAKLNTLSSTASLSFNEQLMLETPLKTLQERPDVRQVEESLLQATALKASAVGDTYPSISLSWIFGIRDVQSTSLQNFLSRVVNFLPSSLNYNALDAAVNRVAPGQTQALRANEQAVTKAYGDLRGGIKAAANPKKTYHSGGANLTFPLIDHGRLEAGVDMADARQMQALHTYEQTIIAAYGDLRGAIETLVSVGKASYFLARTQKHQRDKVTLVMKRSQAGVTHYDIVLEEKLKLNSILQEEQAAKAQKNDAFVTVLKALGTPIFSVP